MIFLSKECDFIKKSWKKLTQNFIWKTHRLLSDCLQKVKFCYKIVSEIKFVNIDYCISNLTSTEINYKKLLVTDFFSTYFIIG